ncbi:MAG: S8 family peptidase [Lachnospiraceae bacterium]|nr:S8 family peptidase [Lachnospiraceae bacterium]
MNHVRKAVRVEHAHRLGILGQNIGIAIVDTGLSKHPDFRSRITGWYDAMYHRSSPYDDSGHGSHVAGIAAGNGFSSQGLYCGIAPEAGLIGVKVLNHKGNGVIADIMNGLNWILRHRERLNIRIVNISIGANDQKTFHENCDFVRKVNQLWDAGLVVVAAAGNKGPGRHTISAPGNSRKIITVGSSDTWGAPGEPGRNHSGTGPTLSCIKKPDVVAPGSRIISCSARSHGRPNQPYAIKSGTSMSTPIVSGAIALLLCLYPDMTPKEVKIRLKNSSTDLHLPHEKQGWGLLNIEKLLS